MARKITATEIFDTVEIDLWGNAYTLRESTRTMTQRLLEAQREARELDTENADPDEMAKTLIGVVDILIAPVNGAGPAADLLTPLWEKEELGLDWLSAFVQTLEEEAGARRRPTSPTRSGT